MRIVFMGTAEFGLPTLRALLDSIHSVPAVVTGPDRARGRGLLLQPSPVKAFARERNLAILQPVNLKEEGFLAALRELEADLFVVVAFRILPEVVFRMPGRGTVNLHASLLPRYRGAAPIQWAVINGEKSTGVSTFFIDEGIDTGHIILQREVAIGDDETAGHLHDRLSREGVDLIMETIEMIGNKTVRRILQDGAAVSPAPKLKKEDGRIDWSRTAEEIHNQVRGMNPVPGAFSELNGRTIKIHAVRMTSMDRKAVPGQIALSDVEEVVVAAGEGWLSLVEVQPEGKKRMSGAEFVRGYRVVDGDRFSLRGRNTELFRQKEEV